MVRSIKLPERLRMVKLLRAHGLRQAERLREDELKAALAELGLALAEGDAQGPYERHAPSSGARISPPEGMQAAPAESPAPDDDFDDPHAAPFFREPKVHLPEAERTFLRLIAVDARHIFATWDLEAPLFGQLGGGVQLRVLPAEVKDVTDEAYALLVADVDARARSWYLRIEGLDRSALRAALLTFEQGAARVLAESNVTVVPPSRPAAPGPLWFATLPPTADRRALTEGALVRALAGEDVALPAGAAVTKTGRSVGPAGEPYETSSSEAFPRRPPPAASLPWSGALPGPFSGTLVRRSDDAEGGAR